MKRIILAALAVLCLGIRLQAGTGIPDISGESHPRLLADKKEFKEYAKAVKTARSVALVNLHKAQMAAAGSTWTGPKACCWTSAVSFSVIGVACLQ